MLLSSWPAEDKVISNDYKVKFSTALTFASCFFFLSGVLKSFYLRPIITRLIAPQHENSSRISGEKKLRTEKRAFFVFVFVFLLLIGCS